MRKPEAPSVASPENNGIEVQLCKSEIGTVMRLQQCSAWAKTLAEAHNSAYGQKEKKKKQREKFSFPNADWLIPYRFAILKVTFLTH